MEYVASMLAVDAFTVGSASVTGCVGSMVDTKVVCAIVGCIVVIGSIVLGLLVDSIVVIASIVDDDTNSVVGSTVDAGIVLVVDELTVVDASVAGCDGSLVDIRVVGPVVVIGSIVADEINLVVGSMVDFAFMLVVGLLDP